MNLVFLLYSFAIQFWRLVRGSGLLDAWFLPFAPPLFSLCFRGIAFLLGLVDLGVPRSIFRRRCQPSRTLTCFCPPSCSTTSGVCRSKSGVFSHEVCLSAFELTSHVGFSQEEKTSPLPFRLNTLFFFLSNVLRATRQFSSFLRW